MQSSARHFHRLVLPGIAIALLWLTGCSGGDRPSYATEMDEPAYRQGESLLKTGRRQEALSSFLKVIERRGDDAPESHLNVGLLYLQHINDPLAAIYHFKKYLALRPNSPQASLVRQRIDFAIREFAKTLPAQPLPAQFERIDLMAKVDRLQQENDELKQQLADVRAGRGEFSVESNGATFDAPGIALPPAEVPVVRTRPSQQQPVPRVATTPSQPRNVASAPAQTQSVQQQTRAARTHVVRQGDTLYRLADQYYRDKARWRDIYAANREVMKSETDLRVGMTIKIP